MQFNTILQTAEHLRMLNFGHTSNSRKRPKPRPNGRAKSVFYELFGLKWPWNIRSARCWVWLSISQELCTPFALCCDLVFSLQWRHDGLDSVSNHQPHHCLLSRLFGRRSKKTVKLRVTGLAGNSPGTGEFPAQMASYAENVSMWWRHHGTSEK